MSDKENDKEIYKKYAEIVDNIYELIMTFEQCELMNTNCQIMLDSIVQECIERVREYNKLLSELDQTLRGKAIEAIVRGYISVYDKLFTKNITSLIFKFDNVAKTELNDKKLH